MATNITQDELKRLYHYEPNTGRWTRLVKTNPRWPVGPMRHYARASITLDGKTVARSRAAWFYMTGEWPKGEVDHRDTNPLNERWDNLRDISHHANCENQQKPQSHNTSGYLGVTWHKHTKQWMAQIKVNRKQLFIGYSKDPAVAHQMYVAKKREVHAGNLL